MTRSNSGEADEGAMDRDATRHDEVPDEVPEDPTSHDEVPEDPANHGETDRDPRAADPANGTLAEAVFETLDRLRTHPRDHRLALVVAALVGLTLAWLHWLGLLLGGALVGLVSRSLGRALLAGIGFGVLVLAVFALTLGDSLAAALAMTPATYLTIAAALVLPAFGSLVRGVV